MASRDSQTVILSRQTIVLVTAVGVGLLTLCYVLGVQVGKQSAALRHPQTKGAGEDLQDLPASVAEQLKAFEQTGAGAENPRAAAPRAEAPKPPPAPGSPQGPTAAAAAPEPAPVATSKAAAPPPAKPEPVKSAPDRKKPADRKTETAPQWSLQLVSTPDSAEARNMAAKARNAGFPTVTIRENGLFKVRLLQSGTREAADATITKLRNRGYRPFAIRTQ